MGFRVWLNGWGGNDVQRARHVVDIAHPWPEEMANPPAFWRSLPGFPLLLHSLSHALREDSYMVFSIWVQSLLFFS